MFNFLKKPKCTYCNNECQYCAWKNKICKLCATHEKLGNIFENYLINTQKEQEESRKKLKEILNKENKLWIN